MKNYNKSKNESSQNLDIFESAAYGQPACFHFRIPAGFTGNYGNWIRLFGRFDGMVVKVGNEELKGNMQTSFDVYNRYKKEYPGKMLVLHYNGNERDPRDIDNKYFPGHWLYYRGCKALTDIAAEAGITVIKVENTELFKMKWGIHKNRNDDILMVKKGNDSKPDWYASEEVILESINAAEGTITVKRGQYNTIPQAFTAGDVYLLPHVTGGPWGEENNLLWQYNFSTECPEDRKGKKAFEVLADEIADKFSVGGVYENFDGIEFDVAMGEFFVFYQIQDQRGIDTDGDLLPDFGIIDGRNRFGEGYLEFLARLRKKMGKDRLILADGNFYLQQRGFGILNGIESEGFGDHKLRDFEWSWGLNRHKFWNENAYGTPFSYLNHKYGIVKNDRMNIDRMAFAASLFSDTYLSASSLPLPKPSIDLPVWDEWVAGEQNKQGWLGAPLERAKSLAKNEKNILENVSFNSSISYILPEADTYVTNAYADMNYGYAPVLHLNRGNAVYISFDIPPGIKADEKALLQFQITNIVETVTDISAVNSIRLYRAIDKDWEEDLITKVNSINKIPLQDTGKVINIDNKNNNLWNKSLVIDITGLLPENGGRVTFCLIAEDICIYTLSSREGIATPKIILNKMGTMSTESGTSVKNNGDKITVNGSKINNRMRNNILFTTDWFRIDGSDLSVFATLNAKKGGTPIEDKARLVQVRAVDRNGKICKNIMAWANNKNFEADFYFSDITKDSDIRLEFEVEGFEQIEFKNLAAYAYPDVTYREYEGGVVIANPSLSSGFTFDLEKYLPDRTLKHIKATIGQDMEANNGMPIKDGKVTLGAYDAVFLMNIQN